MEEKTNYLVHYGVKGMKWRNKKAKLPNHAVTPIYDPNNPGPKAYINRNKKYDITNSKSFKKYQKEDRERIHKNRKKAATSFRDKFMKKTKKRTNVPVKAAKKSVGIGKKIYYKHKMKKATKKFAKKMINNF